MNKNHNNILRILLIWNLLYKIIFLSFISTNLYASSLDSKLEENKINILLENIFTNFITRPDQIFKTNLLQCLGYKKLPEKFITLLPFRSLNKVNVTYEPNNNESVSGSGNKILIQNTTDYAFDKISLVIYNANHSNVIISIIKVNFKNVILDKHKANNEELEFKYLDEISLAAFITQNDLENYIKTFYGNLLYNTKFELKSNQLLVTGYLKQKFLPAKFKCYGVPIIIDNSYINFNCSKLSIIGISLPNLVDALHKEINPIFNAKNFLPEIYLEKIELVENTVICYGKIRKFIE